MIKEDNSAIAIGRNLRISRKYSVEIARFIKGKSTEKAIVQLQGVVKKEQYVPIKRFKSNAGHRTGGQLGRYPVKAAGEFLKLIKSAIENAKYAGLSEKLYIAETIVNTGRQSRTPKRNAGRLPKMTHIKIKVKEK